MKALFSAIFGKFAGEVGWIVLLVVAGVAAWLYVDGARAKADRDAIEHAAELICAGAGAPFPASIEQTMDTKGKPVTIEHARGAACQRKVADLRTFKADAITASAETLANALKDHDTRNTADTLAARANAERLQDALARMEKADADAATNLVDHRWFAALNDVAGLRAPDR